MSEANKAAARQLFDAIGKGNVATLDSLLADDLVEHEEFPGLTPNKEGVMSLFAMLRSAFPDLQVVVNQMVAEGDLVSAFVVFKGTHKGEFLGIPATGKPVAVNVADLVKLQDGKVTEHWGIMDSAGLMAQLGLGAPS
jgi:steroid delta-isomerase-like uncharacterized protein